MRWTIKVKAFAMALLLFVTMGGIFGIVQIAKIYNPPPEPYVVPDLYMVIELDNITFDDYIQGYPMVIQTYWNDTANFSYQSGWICEEEIIPIGINQIHNLTASCMFDIEDEYHNGSTTTCVFMKNMMGQGIHPLDIFPGYNERGGCVLLHHFGVGYRAWKYNYTFDGMNDNDTAPTNAKLSIRWETRKYEDLYA